VDGGRRPHGITLELDRRPGGERVDRDRKAEGEVPHLEDPPDHLLGIGRAVDVERFGAVVEAHALDQPRKTEEMVPVEVGHEDPPDPHERGGRLEELTLGPFPTVEEDEFLLHVERDCARGPLLGRPRAGGAEEDEAHQTAAPYPG